MGAVTEQLTQPAQAAGVELVGRDLRIAAHRADELAPARDGPQRIVASGGLRLQPREVEALTLPREGTALGAHETALQREDQEAPSILSLNGGDARTSSHPRYASVPTRSEPLPRRSCCLVRALHHGSIPQLKPAPSVSSGEIGP